ncbi:MAG: hypothetical protein Q6358_03280 [Candidatus Brocadiales bacterium]|nr:hypothetical protein [Candidatus Brocadiales bacterium]
MTGPPLKNKWNIFYSFFELTAGFSLRLENEANSGFSPKSGKIMAKAGFYTPAYLRHEWRS